MVNDTVACKEISRDSGAGCKSDHSVGQKTSRDVNNEVVMMDKKPMAIVGECLC